MSTHALASSTVKLRDLARIEGVRDNSLVGYGVVVGLSGTGDSSRSKATLQSVKNTLENFGLELSVEDIRASNAAAVIITSELPPFAQPGDRIDVHVSSIGDAKSLTGGTLYLSPLKAVDGQIYAVAQGSITVGGYKFEKNENILQKNHPTVGFISRGALIEKEIVSDFFDKNGKISLVLKKPDFEVATKVVEAINKLSAYHAEAVHAGKVVVSAPEKVGKIAAIAEIQKLRIEPISESKVVINERTGTIVAGSDIMVASVTISHSGLKLQVDTDFNVSQPSNIYFNNGEGIKTTAFKDTEITIENEQEAFYKSDSGVSLSELVESLKALKLSTRDIISILQALKQSGALHAEIIVQ